MSAPSSPASSDDFDFEALIQAELDSIPIDEEVQQEEEQEEGEQEESPSNSESEENGAENGDDGSRKRVFPDEYYDEHDMAPPAKKLATDPETKCPPHPGYFCGMCIICGHHAPESDETTGTNVALKYIHEKFELAGNEIDRLRDVELADVLLRKKLFLVLDLDHTLLNSARAIDMAPEETRYLSDAYFDARLGPDEEPTEIGGCPPGVAPVVAGWGGLHKVCGLHMWTKLRPYVHKFLEEASELFELYVYTMGERVYALTMARLLDPTGKLFKGRIISQRDSTLRHSKDLDVVLGAESAVLIMDDTELVWPKHSLNLIVMDRYHFFASSARQFRRPKSLSEAQSDESEDEGALANAMSVLRRLHERFFEANHEASSSTSRNRDIRVVWRDLRLETLSGCRIVFSRVIPSNVVHPERDPYWMRAKMLGAECFIKQDETITHVVSVDRNTEKAKWAKANGRFLVNPLWLETAFFTWSRPDESNFPVGNGNDVVYSFFKTQNVAVPSGAEAPVVD